MELIGIPYFIINFLENSLLPSSCAPFFEGPINVICCKFLLLEKSHRFHLLEEAPDQQSTYQFLQQHKVLCTFLKSFTSISIFVPIGLFPLPGAINNFLQNLIVKSSKRVLFHHFLILIHSFFLH